MIKNCLNCNSGFETINPNKKYCSVKCKIKVYNKIYGKKSKKKYLDSEKGKSKTEEYHKKYYQSNSERLREKRKKYYYENIEIGRKKRMVYYYNNLEKENSEINKHKRKINKRKYRQKEENKMKMYAWQKNKLKKDKEYYIRSLLRSRVCHAFNYYKYYNKLLKPKDKLIDYEKIIEHLKPFPEDLSKYHIDHIKPLVSFKLIKDDGSLNIDEIKKAFAPENHQWLLAEENLKKWKN